MQNHSGSEVAFQGFIIYGFCYGCRRNLINSGSLALYIFNDKYARWYENSSAAMLKILKQLKPVYLTRREMIIRAEKVAPAAARCPFE